MQSMRAHNTNLYSTLAIGYGLAGAIMFKVVHPLEIAGAHRLYKSHTCMITIRMCYREHRQCWQVAAVPSSCTFVLPSA